MTSWCMGKIMKQNISKYELIKNRIEEKIISGVYKENDKIPSENELCQAYESSRITVRKALDELVTKGVLYRRQGLGTFVRPKESVSTDVKARKVLLVLPNYPELFSAGIVSDMISGIEKVLRKTELSLVTLLEPRNKEDSEKFVQSVRAIEPEGIIYSFYFNDILMNELKKLEIPLVFLDSEPDDNMFDIVTGEDFESAYRATNLAIMEWYTHIGFYSPWNEHFSTCALRCEGVKKALEDSKIKWISRQFKLCGAGAEYHDAIVKFDMVTDIKNYLLENPELEVLIAMNDSAAFAAYKAASELKIKIPEDLKMISYGDYNWSSFPLIGLTTYRQHFSRYGKEAMKLLLQRMQNKIPMLQQRRVVKYDLQRRKSF